MIYFRILVKNFIAEAVIIFLLIFLIKIYLKPEETLIKSDGVFYYDYLTSIFIYHDFVRKDAPADKDTLLYKRIKDFSGYRDYQGYKVNKYPCGTALLQSPFFAYAYHKTTREHDFKDGYQPPFQKATYYAALFYLFFGIFFLKKTLELFQVKKFIILFSQLLLVFATSIIHYSYYDSSFSHIYSFFAITAFIYFIKSYFDKRNLNHFIAACVFLGIVSLVRQINVMIIFFVPFLAGSFKNFREGIFYLFSNFKKTFIGIVLFLILTFLQCFAWYLQTGAFILYSYQGESFNFLNPQIFNILFSYRKGLFVYTPILFISISGLIWFLCKKKYYLFFSWIFFFLLITYVLSSWYCWWYGCSFGSRPYIDFYAVFFILFALLLGGIRIALKILVILISFLTIPLNLIQTYQYKHFVLHWFNMDKEMYWKVFLKTAPRYSGWVWKEKARMSQVRFLKEFDFGDLSTRKNTETMIFKIKSHEIPGFDNVEVVKIYFWNEFKENNDAKIIMTIYDTAGKNNYYWISRALIQFSELGLNKYQRGSYDFTLPPFSDSKEKLLSLEIVSGNQDNILKNTMINLYCRK